MAERKLTGLSFNIFAIIGVLVILPLSVAFVTNLANTNSEEYVSINTDHENEILTDPATCNAQTINEALLLEWVDKGNNMTSAYHYVEQTTSPADDYIYSSIWDKTDPFYKRMANGCPQLLIPRDDIQFIYAQDDHFYLPTQYNAGLIPNYHGYIGYSGDDFTFNITKNLFKHLDDSKDISNIKLTFIDHQTGYDCDNEIFKEIDFKGDMIFHDTYSSKGYFNFEFSQVNSYFVPFDPSINPTEFCHIGIVAEFDFTPFESIEINEIFTDYDNLSATVRLYDFDINNYTFTAPVGQFSPQLPFTGDDYFGFDMSVAYVDNVRTNFYLSGGTLIIGLALFFLAIANTQYYNPVVNFFKPKEA